MPGVGVAPGAGPAESAAPESVGVPAPGGADAGEGVGAAGDAGGADAALSRPGGVELGSAPCCHGLVLISPARPATASATTNICTSDCAETYTVGSVAGIGISRSVRGSDSYPGVTNPARVRNEAPRGTAHATTAISRLCAPSA